MSSRKKKSKNTDSGIEVVEKTADERIEESSTETAAAEESSETVEETKTESVEPEVAPVAVEFSMRNSKQLAFFGGAFLFMLLDALLIVSLFPVRGLFVLPLMLVIVIPWAFGLEKATKKLVGFFDFTLKASIGAVAVTFIAAPIAIIFF